MEDHCNYDGGYRVPCDGYDAARLTLSNIADRLAVRSIFRLAEKVDI